MKRVFGSSSAKYDGVLGVGHDDIVRFRSADIDSKVVLPEDAEVQEDSEQTVGLATLDASFPPHILVERSSEDEERPR